MKNIAKTILTGMIGLFLLTTSKAQKMEKKFHTVIAEIRINAPAGKVWEAMVLDYGQIGNFSPYIYSSNYENGSLKGIVGAERKCNFNEEGTQWVHEKIGSIDSENMVMRNTIIDGAKLPLNKENSQAFYRVKDNGDGTCTASYEFQFRTKPAMMGAIAKGGFKKQLGGTLIGLRHYVETGEKVTPMNGVFSKIEKKYKSGLVIK